MMVHQDDGGQLSIFAGDGELLFACDKGHYWVVEAPTQTVKKTEAHRELGRENLSGIMERFGPNLSKALGID